MKELYKITDKNFSINYMASDSDEALTKYTKHYYWECPEVTKVLTDQDCPITTLNKIPFGEYFHRVVRVDEEYCEIATLLQKGDWDPELNGYRCYKVHKNDEPVVVGGPVFVSIDRFF